MLNNVVALDLISLEISAIILKAQKQHILVHTLTVLSQKPISKFQLITIERCLL